MDDQFLNAILNGGANEGDIRKKIHDELQALAREFMNKGRTQLSMGINLAAMAALGMKINTEAGRIFDELLENSEYESSIVRETDNMGREKFWEDLGRPADAE